MPDDEQVGSPDSDESRDDPVGGGRDEAGPGDWAETGADDDWDESGDGADEGAWADEPPGAGGQHAGEAAVDEEPEFATIASGNTVEEARRKAVEQLRKLVPTVREADVEFVVVEEGARGGLFGRGRTPATVEARVRPQALRGEPAAAAGDDDAAELLREFLQTTVDLMGIPAAVRVTVTADGLHAELSGEDLGRLIGRHGATIDALQLVAALVVNRGRRERLQVVVDSEGYRERRAKALRALAERTAQKVVREARSIALKPMSAAERKVVHLCLRDHPGVETLSEGIEPYRAVVVSPKRER